MKENYFLVKFQGLIALSEIILLCPSVLNGTEASLALGFHWFATTISWEAVMEIASMAEDSSISHLRETLPPLNKPTLMQPHYQDSSLKQYFR